MHSSRWGTVFRGDMELHPDDLAQLKLAKELLENPSFAAKITDLLGKPIEKGIELLPDNWNEKVGVVTQAALSTAANTAIFTLKDGRHTSASNVCHKLAVAATGGAGGFWGLGALAIELPVSTTVMLRSIADIARSEGESIKNPEVKLACIEVFALGGPGSQDDSTETGYYAVRAVLAKAVKEAAEYIAKRGIAEEGAPVLVKLIARVAQRFAIQVTEKAAGQAVPIIGAAAGAVINTVFMDHFQQMARGHFMVRRLERKYGNDIVKVCYEEQ